MRVVIGRESDELNLKSTLILTAKIEEEDIERGSSKCSYSCPIALAIVRGLEENGCNVERVDVGYKYIALELHTGETYNTDIPQEMLDFVFRFDGGYIPEPFTSTLIFERIAN